MLARALDAEAPARWVTADEAYGQDSTFRALCDQRRIGYVVAVPRSQNIGLGQTGFTRVDMPAGQAPDQARKRLSAGEGAKGPRVTTGPWRLYPARPPTVRPVDVDPPQPHRPR